MPKIQSELLRIEPGKTTFIAVTLMNWMDISKNNIINIDKSFAELFIKHLNLGGNSIENINLAPNELREVRHLILDHNLINDASFLLKFMSKYSLDISFNQYNHLSAFYQSTLYTTAEGVVCRLETLRLWVHFFLYEHALYKHP